MTWFGQQNPYRPPAEPSAAGKPKSRSGPRRQWSEEEIFEQVAEVLVDALGVDRDEIRPEASLVKDLGAG